MTLAQFRAPSCRSSHELIAKALTGTWKDEQIFVLQQSLALYDAYTAQLAVCDARIEQYLQAEVGTDLSCFPTSKHFCAWLGLAPRNAISGGKVLYAHTAKVTNRAAQAFRLAAYAVARSETAVGAYYRSMRARKGPQQAIVATAHKIARIVYHLLKTGEAYAVDHGSAWSFFRGLAHYKSLPYNCVSCRTTGWPG